jgi:hypothetical protein
VTVSGASTTFDNFGTVSAGAGAAAGALTNSATFINESGATVTAPVINTGSIAAKGGTFDGAIQNNSGGMFTVMGNVTGANVFTNAAGGTLTVSSGGLTGLPGLANSGGVSVASGATLSASAIINNAGATIGTSGTLASLVTPLINSGTVNANGGAVNGAIDNKNAFNVGGTVVE